MYIRVDIHTYVSIYTYIQMYADSIPVLSKHAPGPRTPASLTEPGASATALTVVEKRHSSPMRLASWESRRLLPLCRKLPLEGVRKIKGKLRDL